MKGKISIIHSNHGRRGPLYLVSPYNLKSLPRSIESPCPSHLLFAPFDEATPFYYRAGDLSDSNLENSPELLTTDQIGNYTNCDLCFDIEEYDELNLVEFEELCLPRSRERLLRGDSEAGTFT
jgi:hypothetical protein